MSGAPTAGRLVMIVSSGVSFDTFSAKVGTGVPVCELCPGPSAGSQFTGSTRGRDIDRLSFLCCFLSPLDLLGNSLNHFDE